ncbi:MAG: cupin domain-containing protein [Solirubrobacterales bacterium]
MNVDQVFADLPTLFRILHIWAGLGTVGPGRLVPRDGAANPIGIRGGGDTKAFVFAFALILDQFCAGWRRLIGGCVIVGAMGIGHSAMMSGVTAREIIDALELEPLPGEGGMFRNTLNDGVSTAIYFLLETGKPTMLHRLPGPEVFHFYAGGPARLHILEPGSDPAEAILGPDLTAGERPQILVPGGTWQAAETLGEWTLLGTTMAPGFRDEDFELGDRDELIAGCPEAAEMITRHTPD